MKYMKPRRKILATDSIQPEELRMEVRQSQ